jgi:hypothetical protein
LALTRGAMLSPTNRRFSINDDEPTNQFSGDIDRQINKRHTSPSIQVIEDEYGENEDASFDDSFDDKSIIDDDALRSVDAFTSSDEENEKFAPFIIETQD